VAYVKVGRVVPVPVLVLFLEFVLLFVLDYEDENEDEDGRLPFHKISARARPSGSSVLGRIRAVEHQYR
jgi:hypothetical protein